MTPKEINQLLDETAAKLAEHGDAVQILFSRVDDDGTQSFFRGYGNWYARQGMAREFLQRDQADTNARLMKDVINPPDENDSWKTT